MSLLGLNDSADNKSFIRFMPSLNGWFVGTDEEVDIKHILIDPGSVKTGWGRIQLGASPDWSFDDAVGQRGLRPGESEEEKKEYKRGFSVDMFGQEIGLRTWSTTTTGSNLGFEKLYEEIHAQMGEQDGKYPVVEYTGSEAIKVGKGNTRVPQFKIVKWVASDEFDNNEPNEVYEEPQITPQDDNTEEIPF